MHIHVAWSMHEAKLVVSMDTDDGDESCSLVEAPVLYIQSWLSTHSYKPRVTAQVRAMYSYIASAQS